MDVISNNEVEKFIQSLDTIPYGKVLKVLESLSKYGNMLGMPLSKYISDGVLGLRTRGNPEIRILYCFYNNQARLLIAYVKTSQKLPKNIFGKALLRKNALTPYNI